MLDTSSGKMEKLESCLETFVGTATKICHSPDLAAEAELLVASQVKTDSGGAVLLLDAEEVQDRVLHSEEASHPGLWSEWCLNSASRLLIIKGLSSTAQPSSTVTRTILPRHTRSGQYLDSDITHLLKVRAQC